jgi:hypothetical protein
MDQVFKDIDTLLRQSFGGAERPVASSRELVDEAEIRRRHRADALAGIDVLDPADRLRAKERAARAADAEIATALYEGEVARLQLQKELDAVRGRLPDNDPGLVLKHLGKVFEDNEARAAAIGLNGSVVDVIVLVPGLDFIPRQKPRIGASGRLTWPALTETERSTYYDKMVCGHVLNTVRDTLAVAPSISGVTTAVVRFADRVFCSSSRLECLLAAHFTRDRLADIDWEAAFAPDVLFGTASDLRMRRSERTRELQPLDISEDPDIGALLEDIDQMPDSEAAADRGGDTSEQQNTRSYGIAAFAIEDLDLFWGDVHECVATVNELLADMPAILARLLRDPSPWLVIIEDERNRCVGVRAEADGALYMEVSVEALPEPRDRFSKKEAAALRLLGWRTVRRPGCRVALVEQPDTVEEVDRVRSTLIQVFKLGCDDLMSVTLVAEDTVAS